MFPPGVNLPRPETDGEPSKRLLSAKSVIKSKRREGHDYLDLRQDGRRIVYMCITCMMPCYSEPILLQHLDGKFHKKMIKFVEKTMRLSNPWPFNDGFVFFNPGRDDDVNVNSQVMMNEASDCSSKDAGDLEVVKKQKASSEKHPGLVVSGVFWKGSVTDVRLKYQGLAQIGATFLNNGKIKRIWCEWLGVKNTDDEDISGNSELDYAIFTVKYANEYEMVQTENKGSKKRKIKSHSKNSTDASQLSSDETALTGSTLDRKTREETRKKLHTAIRIRVCKLCIKRMLPGNDVAALLNLRTNKLDCCSKNAKRGFHVYHISCLLHWILFCEYETRTARVEGLISKLIAKKGETTEMNTDIRRICYPICPMCQGPDKYFEGIILENGPFTESQMFKYFIKTWDGRREWINNPEFLQNCSIGLHYPPESGDIVEERKTLGMLKFYTVDDPERGLKTFLEP